MLAFCLVLLSAGVGYQQHEIQTIDNRDKSIVNVQTTQNEQINKLNAYCFPQ